MSTNQSDYFNSTQNSTFDFTTFAPNTTLSSTNYTTIQTKNFTQSTKEPASVASLSNLVVLSPTSNGNSRLGIDPETQFQNVKSTVSFCLFSFILNYFNYASINLSLLI
jgi:hypothetical protein